MKTKKFTRKDIVVGQKYKNPWFANAIYLGIGRTRLGYENGDGHTNKNMIVFSGALTGHIFQPTSPHWHLFYPID